MSDIQMKNHIFQELKNTLIFIETLCIHFDTTNINFASIESEKMPIFCKNTNISQKFFTSIGLSIR